MVTKKFPQGSLNFCWLNFFCLSSENKIERFLITNNYNKY